MMPNINISQQTYDALKSLAEPFVDHEPEDVIKRLIAQAQHINTTPHVAVDPDEAKSFQPDKAPNLAFTRLKSFTLNGEQLVDKANLWWNPVLFALIAKAAKVLDSEALRKNLTVNWVEGQGQQEKGYKFLPDVGISVQGGDSNNVWRAIYHLSRAIGAEVDVEFFWEDKPKAAHPNQTGRMHAKW